MEYVIIPLKMYWFQEARDESSRRHAQKNKWIDQVLACKKFKSFNLHAMIEFGDYLFLALKNKKVCAFAICIDHPGVKWKIYDNQLLSKPHGFLEIGLLNSDIKGQGSIIISKIKEFAKSVLLRQFLQLEMMDVALKPYYESQGFIHLKKAIMQYKL